MAFKFLKTTEFKIFITLFFTYLVFAKYDGWNENSRADLILSIVNDNSLSINNYHKNTGDKSYFDGHYYSDKAPGISFLGVPVYFIYSKIIGKVSCNIDPIAKCVDSKLFYGLLYVLIIFTSSFFTALTSVLIYKFLKYFNLNKKHRIIVAYIFGLATIGFQYGTIFLGHATGMFLIFLAYYLVYKYLIEKKGNLFIIGFTIMFSFLVDYTNIGFVLVLSIYLLINRNKVSKRQFMNYFLGVSVVLLVFFTYNYLVFNNPFDISYRHLYGGENQEVDLIKGTGFDVQIKYMDKLGWSLISKQVSIPLRILFYSYRGLFYVSPLLLFFILPLFNNNVKNKSLYILTISNLFILLLIYVRFIALWWGGTAFGPRYLLPIVPFMCLFLYQIFDLRKTLIKKLFVVLVVLSFIITLSGNLEWEQTVISPQLSERFVHEVVTNTNLNNTQFQVWRGIILKYNKKNTINNFMIYHDFKYSEKYKRFLPLENPIFSYYLPSLLKKGPKSILIERIFDISLFPWLNFMTCVVVFILIWRKEMKWNLI